MPRNTYKKKQAEASSKYSNFGGVEGGEATSFELTQQVVRTKQIEIKLRMCACVFFFRLFAVAEGLKNAFLLHEPSNLPVVAGTLSASVLALRSRV